VAGVAVGEDMVFAGTLEGRLIAMEKGSGRIRWSRELQTADLATAWPECVAPLGISSQPAVWSGNVYVADGRAGIVAFRQETGEQLWRVDLSQSMAGAYIGAKLLIAGGALYAGLRSATGQENVTGLLAKIDLSDPTKTMVLRLQPEGESGAEVSLSPVYDEAARRVLVVTGPGEQDASQGRWGHALLSIDADTLQVQSWMFLPQDGPASQWSSGPAVFQDLAGTRYVTASTRDGMFRLYTQELEPLWELPVAIGCRCVACGCASGVQPASDGMTVYIGGGISDPETEERGALVAMQLNPFAMSWARRFPGVVLGPLQVRDGRLIVATSEGMFVVDSASGELVSTAANGASREVTVSNDTVYTATFSGQVTAVRVAP